MLQKVCESLNKKEDRIKILMEPLVQINLPELGRFIGLICDPLEKRKRNECHDLPMELIRSIMWQTRIWNGTEMHSRQEKWTRFKNKYLEI